MSNHTQSGQDEAQVWRVITMADRMRSAEKGAAYAVARCALECEVRATIADAALRAYTDALDIMEKERPEPQEHTTSGEERAMNWATEHVKRMTDFGVYTPDEGATLLSEHFRRIDLHFNPKEKKQ